MKWLYAWLVLAAAVMVTVWLFPGIHVDWSPGVYLAIAAVFALVNLSLGTILRIFSLPVMVLTLGLFALVINMIMLMVTALLMPSLDVDTLGAAFGGALVISIVRIVLGFVVDRVRVA